MAQRFSIKWEQDSIWDGIRDDLQREVGTYVDWYRFDPDASNSHDVYDVGESRVWKAPFKVPVVTANRVEGRDRRTDYGLYTNDRLHLTFTFRVAQQVGIEDIERNTEAYLKDRVVYEGVVFTPRVAQIQGTLLKTDTIIGLDLQEVDPEEMVYDGAQFLDFAAYGDPDTTPPEAPVNLTGDPGTGQATLDWEAP